MVIFLVEHNPDRGSWYCWSSCPNWGLTIIYGPAKAKDQRLGFFERLSYWYSKLMLLEFLFHMMFLVWLILPRQPFMHCQLQLEALLFSEWLFHHRTDCVVAYFSFLFFCAQITRKLTNNITVIFIFYVPFVSPNSFFTASTTPKSFCTIRSILISFFDSICQS